MLYFSLLTLFMYIAPLMTMIGMHVVLSPFIILRVGGGGVTSWLPPAQLLIPQYTMEQPFQSILPSIIIINSKLSDAIIALF